MTALGITSLVSPRMRLPLVVSLLGLGFLGIFFLYPIGRILTASILDPRGEHVTLGNYAKVLSSAFYQASLVNSLTIGAVATLFATLLAVPLAFALARLPVAGKSALLTLVVLPLVLPSFVSAYALLLMLGRAGFLSGVLRDLGIPFTSIYGAGGIVAVYALTLYPYVLLPTLAGLKAIDMSIEEASQNLGASRWRSLRTVILPLVIPSILAGALLVFIETLENFGVPFVLAEDKPILSVEAFKLFVGETDQNPASAGVLAVLLIACTALVLLIQRRYLGQRRFATSARRSPPLIEVGPGLRLMATAFAWSVVIVSLIPFFAVVVLAFMKFRGPVLQASFSLDNFAALFQRSARPLGNTLMLSSLAALGAALIGVPIGYAVTRFRSSLTSLLDVVATMPFAVAGTVLGIALIISFNSGALVLTGGWFIMVLAYVVRKLPFSVRSSSSILHQIDPSLEEASINLGVSPVMTLARLTVPLMLSGIIGGMVLTFVTVSSELSATVVLYSGEWQTLTVVMFQALEGTGAGTAVAAACLLVLITLAPLAIIHRLLRRHETSLL
ncbi:iron(III) transport system permease protein [Rhizobiales bacterium GAS188]|nr:iron(III) transport system permease protein [Rhizobiales bacterium GAS188]